MVRKYKQVTDAQRQALLEMVNTEKITIKKAASLLGISYDNARAIHSTYLRFNRVKKITYEERTHTRRLNEAKQRVMPSENDEEYEPAAKR